MKKLIAVMALLLLTGGPTAAASARVRDGTIVADVGVSEWGPPAKLALSLRTGRYSLRTAPPRRRSGDSGVRRIGGKLSSARLARVRAAFAAARAEGLVEPVCVAGGPPPRFVLMNAATPAMVLTGPRFTLASSAELGCWTASADALHGLLETLFGRQARPGG